MPVILDAADWSAWLGEVTATTEELHALLRPYRGQLKIWPVDKMVGNARNDYPGLSKPIVLQ